MIAVDANCTQGSAHVSFVKQTQAFRTILGIGRRREISNTIKFHFVVSGSRRPILLAYRLLFSSTKFWLDLARVTLNLRIVATVIASSVEPGGTAADAGLREAGVTALKKSW